MSRLPLVRAGDWQTPSLGYGAMGLTEVYGDIAPDVAAATLNHVVDQGVTMIDTADVYGFGANEELVAASLEGRRHEVEIATKFGIVTDGSDYSTMSVRNDPDYVVRACEASLRRLRTDVIDLYYLHRRDPRVPIEDVVGAMAGLVEAGKVRRIGLSEVTSDEIDVAASIHPISAIQSEWSLWSRDVERRVVPAAVAHDVGFVAYAPLSRGFLTGALTDRSDVEGDWRSNLDRFATVAFDTNRRLVEEVAALARDIGATPAQVALAWLRQRGSEMGVAVIAIPGTRRTDRVDENIGSLAIELPERTMERLGGLAERVIGRRSDHANPDWVSETREARSDDPGAPSSAASGTGGEGR